MTVENNKPAKRDVAFVEDGRIVSGKLLVEQEALTRRQTTEAVSTLEQGKIIEFTEEQLAINRRLAGIEKRGGLGIPVEKSK